MRRVALALAALTLIAPSALSAQTDTSQDAVIRRVENGLMTIVAVKGQRPEKFTLQSRMQYYRVPAVSIAFFDKTGVKWVRAYGATPETLFQAGSISKPVSAVGIMHLVEQGKLKLDENVNDELASWKVPDNAFTAKQPVTLRELLSHTAGTNVHGFDGYPNGKPVPALLQVLDGKPPANSPAIRVELQPGTKFQYSGGGYVIALQLVLDTVHEPFATYMHDAVLAPLGMTNSTFEQPLPQALWSRAAVATDPDGKPYPGKFNVYPEQTAAGLWTTPTDLAKFAIGMNRALDGDAGSLLSAATARDMLTPIKEGYGLGFAVGGTGRSARFGHNGANDGFQAIFTMHRDGDGVAIMTNSDNGVQLMTEVLNSLGAAYGWSEQKPTEKALYPMAPAKLARYAGRYKVPGLTFNVAIRNKNLYMKGQGRHWLRMYPESPNTFFLLTEPIDIRFNIARSGAVASFTIVQFGNMKAVKVK